MENGFYSLQQFGMDGVLHADQHDGISDEWVPQNRFFAATVCVSVLSQTPATFPECSDSS